VGKTVESYFVVEHLDSEKLLAEWRWLCPAPMTLVARSAFGDLFLRAQEGAVFWLDAAIGKLTRVCDSEADFREIAKSEGKRAEWFAEVDARAAEHKGLKPGPTECIGFKMPLALAQQGVPNPPYIADLYEYTSFLGDLNRQISELPDGSKVRLEITP
jgi:hypothetical protein